MPHCAVIWCNNQSKNINKRNSDVSYHKFPSDPYIKDKWILATGKYNWCPQKYDTICSNHFEAECFTKRSTRSFLAVDATPTLKLHPMFEEIRADAANEGFKGFDISNIKSSQISPPNLKKPEETNSPNISDTPQIHKLKLSLLKARQTIKKSNLLVKRLRERNRRLIKKTAQMELVIKFLREVSATTVI